MPYNFIRFEQPGCTHHIDDALVTARCSDDLAPPSLCPSDAFDRLPLLCLGHTSGLTACHS